MAQVYPLPHVPWDAQYGRPPKRTTGCVPQVRVAATHDINARKTISAHLPAMHPRWIRYVRHDLAKNIIR